MVKLKSITIVKFTKNDKGVSVTINNTETINVLVGIAETIQLISKETKHFILFILCNSNNNK